MSSSHTLTCPDRRLAMSETASMNDVVICLFGAAGYDKSAQGLAGAGRRLADELGGRLRAIVIGADAATLAAEVASVVDSATVVDQAELAEYHPEVCLSALTKLCGDLAPRAVLLGNDAYSQELAPRLAHRLNGSAVGDGVEMRVQNACLRVVRQVYGGKAQAVIELKRKPAVVWLRARSFAPALRREAAGEITRATLEINTDFRTRVVERKREETGNARLEDARVIVSGGRGIGGAEPVSTRMLPPADLICAQGPDSRGACAARWGPPTWQSVPKGSKGQ